MKRIIMGLGLLLGAAVAGFLQAGGLSHLGSGVRPAPRGRTAERQVPREVDARFRSAPDMPPPLEGRAARSRLPDRRRPARWDDRGAGYRDGPSRPYPVRPPDRR